MVSAKFVWYCKEGEEPVAIVSDKRPVVCPECGKDMLEIGWFESDKEQGTKEQEDRAGDE